MPMLAAPSPALLVGKNQGEFLAGGKQQGEDDVGEETVLFWRPKALERVNPLPASPPPPMCTQGPDSTETPTIVVSSDVAAAQALTPSLRKYPFSSAPEKVPGAKSLFASGWWLQNQSSLS